MNKRISVHGFTLIELLIVVALLGLLLTAGFASYIASQQRANDARRVSDLKAIQNAEEQYFINNDSAYPNSVSCDPGVAFLPQGMPKDPKTGNSYLVGGNCTALTYYFCATLEPNPTTSGNATAIGPPPTFSQNGGQYYCVQNLQ